MFMHRWDKDDGFGGVFLAGVHVMTDLLAAIEQLPLLHAECEIYSIELTHIDKVAKLYMCNI